MSRSESSCTYPQGCVAKYSRDQRRELYISSSRVGIDLGNDPDLRTLDIVGDQSDAYLEKIDELSEVIDKDACPACPYKNW